MPIIPESQTFDQRTLSLLLIHDPLVQRYRAFFALFDWGMLPTVPPDPSQPGRRPHPPSASVKALLLKIEQGFKYCTQLRRFLVEHPLLVLERGFRPVLDYTLPYGFDVEGTVPSARWLREQPRNLEQAVLQALLAATITDLCEEVPGLGEVVADARDPHLCLGAGKQPTRLRQRSL